MLRGFLRNVLVLPTDIYPLAKESLICKGGCQHCLRFYRSSQRGNLQYHGDSLPAACCQLPQKISLSLPVVCSYPELFPRRRVDVLNCVLGLGQSLGTLSPLAQDCPVLWEIARWPMGRGSIVLWCCPLYHVASSLWISWGKFSLNSQYQEKLFLWAFSLYPTRISLLWLPGNSELNWSSPLTSVRAIGYAVLGRKWSTTRWIDGGEREKERECKM